MFSLVLGNVIKMTETIIQHKIAVHSIVLCKGWALGAHLTGKVNNQFPSLLTPYDVQEDHVQSQVV